jgi:predicted nucleic acid-binding protein
LFDPTDAHHVRCRSFLAKFNGKLLTTWQVLTEAHALLGVPHQTALLTWLDAAIKAHSLIIEASDPGELDKMRALIVKYGDLPMDFADVSLYLLAVRLRVNHVATVDRRDFDVYRLPGNRRFVNVLD